MAIHSQTIQRRTSGLSPEFALLGFLEQSPAHGYELHQRLMNDLGEIWHANLSQTYNILTRLENQGFIEGRPHPQEKRRRTRTFRVLAGGTFVTQRARHPGRVYDSPVLPACP
jgi:DNA-binding PadR family transcriptional regulator